MEWFYEQDGQQVGPVSRTEVIRLIVQRRIHPHTLVWTPEYGDQWRPAMKAGLMVPLPKRFRGKVETTSEHASAEKHTVAVSFLWAWMYLIVPGGLALVLQSHVNFNIISGIPLATVLLLQPIRLVTFLMDRRVLQSAGITPPSLWWFFFFPGYFIVRQKRLGRGRVLSVLSIVLYIALFLVSVPAIEKSIHQMRMEAQHEHVETPQHEDKSAPQSHDDDDQEPPSDKQITI